ncbi:hypothetical protein ACJVC5_14715 [Peredibacter sp. HCB2-198]|uniref:hypothetical protein n=1 Tax=Peredibacter sp. HCB2-198 TaxID=3383025 RepID=UPI0038B59DF0
MKMLLITLLLIVTACGKDSSKKSSVQTQNPNTIFGASQITVKVYYQEGAEPYTEDSNIALLKYWTIYQKNIEALFNGRSPRPTLVIPTSLSQMTKIPSVNVTKWSIEDILSLAKTVESSESGLVFKIFFVKGEYAENSNVLGFHISNTYTMAVFKDIIARSGSTEERIPQYVEQATIIHETGHALGLVNNGLPMKAAHQDSEHGAHCSEPTCVMYWQNEGTSGLRNFVKNLIINRSTVMFDSQCLNDAQNY